MTRFIYLQGSTVYYKKLSADKAAPNSILKAAKSESVIRKGNNLLLILGKIVIRQSKRPYFFKKKHNCMFVYRIQVRK